MRSNLIGALTRSASSSAEKPTMHTASDAERDTGTSLDGNPFSVCDPSARENERTWLLL